MAPAYVIGFVIGALITALVLDWIQERAHRRLMREQEADRQRGHFWRPCVQDVERREG